MSKRDELVAKIALQNPQNAETVVSLEDFFEGNDDLGSIGPNLDAEQPSLEEFYKTLSTIRTRADVQDVLVRIYDIQEDAWPHTDTVYVLSSAPPEEIAAWLAPLRPDEIHRGWMYGKPPAAPVPWDGYVPYSVWWD